MKAVVGVTNRQVQASFDEVLNEQHKHEHMA